MSANVTNSIAQRSRIHPLIAGAAVSVILASATGVAAMTGILPVSHATPPASEQVAPAVAQAASAPLTAAQQTGVVQQTNAAQPVAQPVAQQAQTEAPKPVVHHTHKPRVAPAPQYANGDYSQASAQPAGTRQVAADPYAGEVVAVNAVQSSEPTTGLGAVGGAVAGGLIGNQFGGGRGRILATVVGAVGGGVAGNGIEHAVRKQTSYQVQVRMQDGSYRNFTYATQPQVQVGQRVHVSGDSLTAS
ncbi:MULTISPECIES: glycine zipper 2TM domain-containing protein [Paraburkholderia]|uniref:glycine zipper 2TM domain-containing protein n=1 Tax=Paraburkholderia TaxID=1822464 RepID=UPI001CB2CC41|nr:MULTISPECIES: glycine zipper 2TM domain-containing protein [Paraburkholderia]BEU25842.1 glycine zipper 2TM domain-containing protein [Paraburkholderia sp. 22B1P]GJH06697.1 glycine zipper 2TM domain-containing protein [Paraburkholderia terrae]GJH33176.1 glycine zipper 2TM domain-containing protein [Paraburkholderia hospita]CAG9246872.1 Outer membrane lipoprotein [Paraburkholderia caribensis]